MLSFMRAGSVLIFAPGVHFRGAPGRFAHWGFRWYPYRPSQSRIAGPFLPLLSAGCGSNGLDGTEGAPEPTEQQGPAMGAIDCGEKPLYRYASRMHTAYCQCGREGGGACEFWNSWE